MTRHDFEHEHAQPAEIEQDRSGDAATEPQVPAEDAPEFRRPPAGLFTFKPWRMTLDLLIDRLLWIVALVVLIILLIGVSNWTQQITTMTILAMVAAVVGWMMLNILSARTHREVSEMAGLIESDTPEAARYLARLMRRRPLLRWVRLLLYHRMALLRHAQGRYDETSQICQALTERPLGRAERVRANTLLTLAHARMQLSDHVGAYEAMVQLERSPMNLLERMMLVSLRTRYELGVQQYALAVSGAYEKVQLSELMPPVLCGSLHVMLGRAAEAVGDQQMASWMNRRAELLLTPQQLDDARSGRNVDGFELSVVTREPKDGGLGSS